MTQKTSRPAYSIMPTADQLLSFQINHYAQRLKEAREQNKSIKERSLLRKTLHELRTKRAIMLN